MNLPARDPTEERVRDLWGSLSPGVGSLQTRGGDRLWVLYPGRSSAAAGPDFRDAVLLTQGGQLLRGDVEVHVREEGWEAHGHQRDRRYRRVVLHVVLWPARGKPLGSSREGEAGAPLVALFPLVARGKKNGMGAGPAFSFPFTLRAEAAGRALEEAGKQRFLAKASRFARSMRDGDPEEVLYQGLMEALGYSQNRAPFLALAQGLPLGFLRRATLGQGSPEERLRLLQALYLGSAGFLPEAGTLVDSWHALGGRPLLDSGGWSLFRVRPGNHPARRLMGMAHLLNRNWSSGLLRGLERVVIQGEAKGVEAALTVAAPGEAGASRQSPSAALIGAQRAGEMAVNVALPFFFAWGRRKGMSDLTKKAWALFARYPALEDNELTREAKRWLPPSDGVKVVNSARTQQGLIHLYRQTLQGRSTA